MSLEQCLAGQTESSCVSTLRRSGAERGAMLEAVGALYGYGQPVAWKRLHPEGGRVVPLPTYPWQRQRYWLEGLPSAAPASKDPLGDCIFELVWRQKAPSAQAAAGRAEGSWLVLADGGGVGSALCDMLRERGNTCIRVAPGARYERVDATFYRIDPHQRDDYARLIQDAFGKGEACAGVVHLFGLDVPPWDERAADTLDAGLRLGLSSVLSLVQAVLRRSWRDKPRTWLVTRGAQAVVEGASAGSPVQGTIWGFARTMALEHPELACVRVDLDTERGGYEEVRALFEELQAKDDEEEVALRRGGRFVARLVRGSVEGARANEFQLRSDATYLVTGGLGGLGLSAAQWMVERGARHLALVGRRGPSDQAKETIRAMEAAGAAVRVFSADISRREDVEGVSRAIELEMPALRGIVHSAGVTGERAPIAEATFDELRSVALPKVHGAAHLHAISSTHPLDFFVLYSSVASLLGVVGQAGYSAANAFLDALARARRSRGLPVTSVQWGAFAGAGMAEREGRASRISRGGVGALSLEEGTSALARLLAHPRAEVAVMRFDVRQWMDAFPQIVAAPFWSELREEARRAGPGPEALVESKLGQALEAAPAAARRGILEEHLREVLGTVLRMDARTIHKTTPFTNLGVDSIMSLEVRNRLEKSLGLVLPATLLFTYTNLDTLGEHILCELNLPSGLEPQADARAPEEASKDLEAELAQLGGEDLLSLLDEELSLARKGPNG
jgi:acyl transferase domain-containing protein